MSKFSELAKQQRLMLHETQEQYAKRFGFQSATACSLWEAGERKVPEKVIESLIFDALPKFSICSNCGGRGMVEIDRLSSKGE